MDQFILALAIHIHHSTFQFQTLMHGHSTYSSLLPVAASEDVYTRPCFHSGDEEDTGLMAGGQAGATRLPKWYRDFKPRTASAQKDDLLLRYLVA